MVHKKEEIVDGITIKYHANGHTVWSKGRVENGAADGYWEWYRQDGTIKRSGTFRNGVQAGKWTTYDKDGKPYKTTFMD